MKKIVATACLVVVFVGQGFGQGLTGKTGWLIFRKARTAKFKALTATAVAGVRGDLSGLFYNPAVLGTVQQGEVFFLSELGLTEDKFGGLVYGQPLGNGGIAGGILYYDAGKIELNWIENGRLETQKVSAQRDLFGILSYGRKLKENLYAGGTFKLASSSLLGRKPAYAFAGDAGIFWLLPANSSISTAVQNFGGSTKFLSEKNPLPFSGCIGAGWFCKIAKAYLAPGFDLTYNFAEKRIIPEAGIEFGLGPVSLNAGYRYNAGYKAKLGEANLQVGFCCSVKNFDFGYAYVPGIYLNPTHRVDMGFRFGKTKSEKAEVVKREKARRVRKTKSGYITVDRANLRSAPSTRSEIIARILESEKVEIMSKKEDWYYISYKGKKGYLHQSVIELGEKVKKANLNYIFGKITDYRMEPLSGVVVKVSRGDFVKRWKTDTKGNFKTEELPFAEYEVKVWKKGYISPIEKVTVGGKNPTRIDFVLKKK